MRRFPDEKITRRYWFDKMSTLSIFKERMTLSFEYQEDLEGGRANEGEGKKYFHHFHSKQVSGVCTCYADVWLYTYSTWRFFDAYNNGYINSEHCDSFIFSEISGLFLLLVECINFI